MSEEEEPKKVAVTVPLHCLSGPSFAREIAEGLATAVVVASEDRRIAFDFRDLLASESFRVFTSADVVGLEVGGGSPAPPLYLVFKRGGLQGV